MATCNLGQKLLTINIGWFYFIIHFKDSMRPEFARTPLEITNFTQDTFKASITKFSPYCDQSIVFNWGKTRVMIKTRGDQDSNKEYDCDLFGCGLQGVTMEIDPFRDNDTYQVCLNSSFMLQ